MKGKILSLFDENAEDPDNKKYSKLLEEFVATFESGFKKLRLNKIRDIFDFSVNAWNAANITAMMSKRERETSFSGIDRDTEDGKLLQSMIDYKIAHFPKDLKFIADYEITVLDTGLILTVATQEREAYLQAAAEEDDDESNDLFEYDENFVNRNAVILKIKEPFINWISKIAPEVEEDEIRTPDIFLINETIEDIEPWVRKKFEKFFSHQLEIWTSDKRQWPSKRTYKMFKEWFNFEVSEMVYDFEKEPVRKS